MITPNESTTFVPRREASDDPVKVPLVLIVGDNQGNVPEGRDRIASFTGSLVVGRREPTQGEPGQSSLVLADRMVSSQHMAITPAPDSIAKPTLLEIEYARSEAAAMRMRDRRLPSVANAIRSYAVNVR